MNKVRHRRSASGLPGEKFAGKRIDDGPLVGIGILCLVDQDVVGPLIELIAHPLTHPRLVEQPAGPGNEIVEVGDSLRALGADIGLGKCLAGPKSSRLDVARSAAETNVRSDPSQSANR